MVQLTRARVVAAISTVWQVHSTGGYLSKLTVLKRGQFLDHLRNGWSITASAGKIGVSRQAVYALRASDHEFSRAWEDAYEAGTDVYEDEVKRRAIDGTEKPVFYQGEIVGHIREYSDTLLIVALKGRRPEKYRERVTIDVNKLDTDIERELALITARGETGTTGETEEPIH